MGSGVKNFSHFWFRTLEEGDRQMNWYRVDVPMDVRRKSKRRRTNEEGQGQGAMEIIRPHTQFESYNWESSCAVVGSYMCSAGGYEFVSVFHPLDPIDTIHCLDTSNPNLLWTRGNMATPRLSPIVLPMDAAKVCIIGGTEDRNNFAEIFDLGTMKSLHIMSPLPDNFSTLYVTALFLPTDKERILLFSFLPPCAMVSYHLHTGEWNQLPNPPALEVDWIPLLSHLQPINSAVVFTTLYWYSHRDAKFYAYDYVNNKFSQSASFRGHGHPWIPSARVPSFLHLSGDTFYLVWAKLLDDLGYYSIHFTELHIFKSTDPERLTVDLGTTHNYFIEDKDFSPPFLDALLM